MINQYTDYTDNQYDEMKSLLEKSKRLFEQVEMDTTDLELTREKEKTEEYEVSSGRIVVHGYTTNDITLTDEEWSGKLVKFDIEFFYTVGERNGVYINGNMVKVDSDSLEMLGSLKNYFQTFSTKWAKILADRKSTKTMEDENE